MTDGTNLALLSSWGLHCVSHSMLPHMFPVGLTILTEFYRVL